MLNVNLIKGLFEERDEFDTEIFAYNNNLTYNFSVNCQDVRVSDSKGNEICIYNDGSGINMRVWAKSVSKKLNKAAEEIKNNISTYYPY